MTDIIRNIADGFLKTQKAELIDQITNNIAGLFDPNASLTNQISQTDSKTITTLQYPLDLESDDYQHKIIFKAKTFKTKSAANGNILKVGGDDGSNSIKNKLRSSSVTHSIIHLYQPNDISTQYTNSWASEELGIAGAFNSGASSSELINAFADRGAVAAISGVAGQIGLKARAAEQSFAKAVNPRLAMLFNGVEHRQFSFTFRFAPKSENEVLHCIAIIKSFKYFSAPGLSQEKSFFNYPELFEITMKNGKNKNTAITQFGLSALTNIELNYSPSSVWQTFANGFPVVVDMTLQFREIDIITKKEVLEGL